MPDIRIDNSESIARAIFQPAMIDASGNISIAAFSLRHNENYFSVARMSVNSWIEDIKCIPQTVDRKLCGYCKLIVGEVRMIDLSFHQKTVLFDIEDFSSSKNKSHAGITVSFANQQLKGDKAKIIKPLEKGIPAPVLMLKIQTRLMDLASKGYTTFPS